jgi:pimeloyl-ACP methyl ester carboxylesterase
MIGRILLAVTLLLPVTVPDHAGLAWAPCPGIDDPDLRCATVRVPLDYRRPAGPGITITISRLPATDPARRRGVLVTTGGGPGAAGVPLPGQLRGLLDPEVSAVYDLVGFDLRFVGRSSPITCGQPAEEPGGFWVRVDGFQPFDTTAAQARALARDCARDAGWALPFATTANAARDLDRIRAALGVPRVSYLGGSSAALVGVAYRTLFPDRVDRLVLDSPPDYASVWRPYELDRTAAMVDNWNAFATWVAAGDTAYHLGATPAAVSATLTAAARGAPVPAGGHAWTSGELGYLFTLATFFEQLWPVLALDLTAILSGAAPPVPLDVRPVDPPGVPADNATAVNLAFRCGDAAWPRDPSTYRDDLAVYSGQFPVFGAATANIGPCAFWPVHRDNRPPVSARPAPALILAALHDAAVPPGNSVATHAALPGSRLVTVDRRVHVPLLSGQGGGCLTAAVTAYLVTGGLPPADLAC